MADRPESLESVGRVSNGRHPRLMSCDECPRWTRSPSSSSSFSSPSSPSAFSLSSSFSLPFTPHFYASLSFVPVSLSYLPSSRPFCDPFVAVHLALLAQERESRMTDSVESLFRSANRKLETSDRAAMPRPHDKKIRAAPPSEPACKICRSVVNPRGTVTRPGFRAPLRPRQISQFCTFALDPSFVRIFFLVIFVTLIEKKKLMLP